MSNTNVTTPFVALSANDINGGVANAGKTVLEKYLKELHEAMNSGAYVISGGLLPGSAANLTLIVPAGSAYIYGYYLKWGQTNVTLPASSLSHIYVKLTFDGGGNVDGMQIEDNTSGTPPGSSVKLGVVQTNGSQITASTDQRLLNGNSRDAKLRRAVISSTGSTVGWVVPTGIFSIRVRQWGAGGGGGSGGGGNGSVSGGDGSNGGHGGYIESVVPVNPEETIQIINGIGGNGGSGSSGAGNAGAAGSQSSIVGANFNFINPGGPGGKPGTAASGSIPGRSGAGQWDWNIPSASAGTLDVAQSGLGAQGGKGSDGTLTGSSTAGISGRNGFTIIEY
jgi:hypothetical protein